MRERLLSLRGSKSLVASHAVVGPAKSHEVKITEKKGAESDRLAKLCPWTQLRQGGRFMSHIFTNAKWLAVAVGAALVFSVEPVFATKSFITGAQVTGTRYYADGFMGGCVAKIEGNVNTDGDAVLACAKTGLVAFDCVGTNWSKSIGQAMFQQAQLALVAARPMDFYLNDDPSKQIDGVCITELANSK